MSDPSATAAPPGLPGLATPPPLPPRGPLTEAERAELIGSLTPEQRAELLAAVPDIGVTPPPAGPIGMAPTGRHVLEFTTPDATGTTVVLNVDGEEYKCSPVAPSDLITNVLEAHRTGDRELMLLAIRPLLTMAMYPGDRDRYAERCRGMVEVADATGGPPRVLNAIGIDSMIDHGIKLVEVYLGRPMGALPSFGNGGAPA